jgi:hypothetical protein
MWRGQSGSSNVLAPVAPAKSGSPVFLQQSRLLPREVAMKLTPALSMQASTSSIDGSWRIWVSRPGAIGRPAACSCNVILPAWVNRLARIVRS